MSPVCCREIPVCDAISSTRSALVMERPPCDRWSNPWYAGNGNAHSSNRNDCRTTKSRGVSASAGAALDLVHDADDHGADRAPPLVQDLGGGVALVGHQHPIAG